MIEPGEYGNTTIRQKTTSLDGVTFYLAVLRDKGASKVRVEIRAEDIHTKTERSFGGLLENSYM